MNFTNSSLFLGDELYQMDDDSQEFIYENRSDTGCFIDLIYVIYLRNSLFGIFSVIWVIVYRFKIVQGQPESHK